MGTEKGTVGSSFAYFQRIEELQAKLAEAKVQLSFATKKWAAAAGNAYDLRAAIPRAYQMGLDAGRGELLPVLEGLVGPHWSDAWYGDEETDKPQPLTPPADLVERVKGG